MCADATNPLTDIQSIFYNLHLGSIISSSLSTTSVITDYITRAFPLRLPSHHTVSSFHPPKLPSRLPLTMPTFTVYKGSKDGVVKSSSTRPDELKGDEVFVKVTASGLCGTGESYTFPLKHLLDCGSQRIRLLMFRPPLLQPGYGSRA
jgi:hypothetical protein